MSRRPVDLPALVEGVASGRKRAVARAITLVENRDPLAYDLVRELYPRTGSAAIAGFTGPPGVGKSSLLGALVGHLRAQGKRIGVVSVDPSSPFSKGALLGDRIRLADHFLDEGVFIRSMSTRGHLGGVAEATLQALLILDAAGMDVLLLETVGVGQSEVEVASVADTVVLVLQPGSGDSIQALKAGVMEIPDIIVINKSDHPAAKTMRTEIRGVLSLDRDRGVARARSSRPRRSRARAPRRCGRPSSTTAPSWSATAGSTPSGARTSSTRSSRWPSLRPGAGWTPPSRPTPSCARCSTRCTPAGSIRSPRRARSPTGCSASGTRGDCPPAR